MDRFLVTGGAGFIGSHIVEALVKQGKYVRVLDNFSSGKISNLKDLGEKVDILRGDICSGATCLQATKGIDYVLHQAALRSVPQSMLKPHDYNRVNIDGTLNMLEAARQNKVKRLVFASSSSVYGDIKQFPEKEDFYPELISPYALSKLAGEYYCRIFSRNFGLSTIALRYFNVFGPRQALDDDYAVVIPKFINCLLHDQPCPIFGNGRQSRDFTYVENVVSANLLAAGAKINFGIFNVAAGKDTTVLELVRILNRILGKNIPPRLLPVRPGDVFRTLADISQTSRALKFKPTVSLLEGLKKTVKFWAENG